MKRNLEKKKRDLINTLKDNRALVFWLSLFVIVAIVRFGRYAPAVILAVFFKYTLIMGTLMFMPFVTGAVGFSKSIKAAWFTVLILPLLMAVMYQLLYHENVLRLWYHGEFDWPYLSGWLEACTIVPSICFVLGLVFRIFWRD